MIRRIPQSEPDAAAAVALAQCAPLAALRAALDETRHERALRARLCAQLERVLRALLAEELTLRPRHIAALVERELVGMRRAREIELRVHPQDVRLLEPVEPLRERLELLGQVRVVEDAGLARGGCVLLSNLGEVDARLETRLELALAQLAREVLDEP
jgi:flagellar biosynthesis/type III secretory pathway protein FliH